jgi:Fe-S-cluster containining protein
MLPADRDAIQYFPYAVKADGSCEKFQDGKCTVYEKRPLICNMERMYNKYYRPANVPKKVFYDMAGNACNSLILQNGGSEKQLVKPH